jgi:tetratricopeptide (TPR) repeat protein
MAAGLIACFGTASPALAQAKPTAHGDAAKAAEAVPTTHAADHAKARQCFDTGQAAYLAGRLDEARQSFECAYAELPSAELAWNLARVCERMGAVEPGVRYFRDYLARASVTARERKKVEARIQGLLDLAARQLPLKAATPTSRASLDAEARVFFERGVKLYRATQYDAAAAAFAAALQLSEAPELHYNLAMTAERLGHDDDAADHYRAYLTALPEAPDREAVETRLRQLHAARP